MGLASVIHPGMPRLSPATNWSRLQLAHHHIISFRTGLNLSLSLSLSLYKCIESRISQLLYPSEFGLAVGHSRGAEYFPIACSRGTEQEDHLSTSGAFCVCMIVYSIIFFTTISLTKQGKELQWTLNFCLLDSGVHESWSFCVLSHLLWSC